MKKLKCMFFSFLLIPTLLWALPLKLVEGVDYQVIANPDVSHKMTPKGKVKITEFFNYGCPACFYFDSFLEKWLKEKGDSIEFDRSPVVFEPQWQLYAKTYFALKELNLENKMTPIIFNAIHVDHRMLATNEEMINFLVENNVDKQAVTDAMNASPTIDARLAQAKNLSGQLQIDSIPSIVVAGKYITNGRINKGDPAKTLQIVDLLIEKVKQDVK